MHGQLVVNSLAIGFSYALVAVSFSLIYSTAGFFHLAHAAVYSFAAYFLFTLSNTLTVPLPAAVALSITGAAGLGAAVNIFIYKPLIKRGSSRAVLLLSSLGIMIVIQNLISMIYGDATLAIRRSEIIEGMSIFNAHLTQVQVITIIAGVILPLVLTLWLRFSRTGRMVRAVASDKELSIIVGIDSDRMITFAFIIGSAIAGVAAILSAYDTDLTPMMGFRNILFGVVAAIVGGIGKVQGALLGGILIGVSQTFGSWVLPTQWQEAIAFLILLVFLILRPYGIFGNPRTSATRGVDG